MNGIDAVMDEALRIAREREESESLLRRALLEGNMDAVCHQSAKLCGLTEVNGRYVV